MDHSSIAILERIAALEASMAGSATATTSSSKPVLARIASIESSLAAAVSSNKDYRELIDSFEAVKQLVPEVSRSIGQLDEETTAPGEAELSDEACRQLLRAAAPGLPEISKRYDELERIAGRASDPVIFAGSSPQSRDRIERLERRIDRAREAAAAIRSDVLACVDTYEAMMAATNARLVGIKGMIDVESKG